MISNSYSCKNALRKRKSRSCFFSHVLLQIATTRSSPPCELSWESFAILLENSALFDRTARATLRESVGLSVSMWSGNHDEWLTQAMSSALLLREACCAPARRYISLHSFSILLISHPSLVPSSAINSRSFGPRFNDRLDWERGGPLRKERCV